jgi:hypothetical protein
VSLSFPAGVRASAVSPADVGRLLQRISHWRQADVAVDATSMGSDTDRPLLEELFRLAADQPVAVMVIARPRTEAEVKPRIEALSDRIDALEAHRAGRGTERLRLARAEAELEYLEEWSTHGCWELEVWTGADSPEGCDAVAGMIGGCGDIAGTALLVRPGAHEDALGREWGPRCLIGGEGLVALARSPGRELAGVRAVDLPDFDLNLEHGTDVTFGSVLDATRWPGSRFGVPLASLNRHAFVCGATGSGKSHTVRAMLHGLTAAGVPWLVIEPAKAEYASRATRAATGPLLVIRPGDPTAPPASLNPLEPSTVDVGGRRHQFPLQTHLDLVRALFTASFEAEEPFPQILAAALTRAYEHLGWNLAVGRALQGPGDATPRWPTLSDLQRHALGVVDSLGYGREVRDNVRGFVRVRIDSLRMGTPGRFFEGGHPLDLERVLVTPTVFEIEDLGDDNDKAFFIGTIIIRLFEMLRLRHSLGLTSDALTHVLVVEEAHRLLRRAQEGSQTAHAVTMFANLLAEVRAYGQGLVIAEQIPTKVLPDVVKNSAVKLMHRLPSADDRDFVGATMNLTPEQSAHVVALAPGEAVAHVDGMDRPVLVAVDAALPASRGTHQQLEVPVRARSDACPASCGVAPCTLQQLEMARHLEQFPSVRLWAEVAVVAHLTGEQIGTPAGSWFTVLRAIDPRQASCAIGLAVDDSVDRRSNAIRLDYDPRKLKRHVAGLLVKQLEIGRGLRRPAWAWRIGQYRYVDIARALDAAPAEGESDQRPHPSTAEWEQRGVSLPGPTWAAQLAQLREAAKAHTLTDPRAFGGEPFVLGELAAELGVGSTSAARLTDAVARLGLDSSWLVHRIGDSWEKERQ